MFICNHLKSPWQRHWRHWKTKAPTKRTKGRTFPSTSHVQHRKFTCKSDKIVPSSKFLKQCVAKDIELNHYGVGDSGSRAISMALKCRYFIVALRPFFVLFYRNTAACFSCSTSLIWWNGFMVEWLIYLCQPRDDLLSTGRSGARHILYTYWY